jgi:cytochrome c biogenesis protein CcdA
MLLYKAGKAAVLWMLVLFLSNFMGFRHPFGVWLSWLDVAGKAVGVESGFSSCQKTDC